LLNIISNYIIYLKETHKLAISIHFNPSSSLFLPLADAFSELGLNMHTHPYCYFIKNDRKQHRRCLRNQAAVLHRCKQSTSFVGTCHAGVKEYVYTIRSEKELLGFISVSGYRGKNRNVHPLFRTLSDSPIPIALLDTVIPPLAIMICEFSKSLHLSDSKNNLFHRIICYLEEHFATTSLDELCSVFGYSRSHISHIFKKNAGCSINQYCNRLKIRHAKHLLCETDFSVTDIAFAVGFSDFSYFIRLFREETGITPLVFRKTFQPSQKP